MKAIAQAQVKTDKIAAGTLGSLHAAGYLPQIWTPDAATERKRRLAARRYQVVRHVRELDRLAEDSALVDHEIAQVAIDDPAVRRLITITGVNLTVAAGIVAAIGDISRFKNPLFCPTAALIACRS